MSLRKCIIAMALLGSGCAAAHKPVSAITESKPRYAMATSGSLVFDPPVAIGQPPLQLGRDSRQASAFAGYDSSTTTFFYVRTEDRQGSDGRHDRYERDSVSEKVGVNYR
jgi:hypothetical protein